MFHVYTARFDVTKNFEKFWVLGVNFQMVAHHFECFLMWIYCRFAPSFLFKR